MKMFYSSVKILLFVIGFDLTLQKYQPTWQSIDSRPLPTWYDDSKFGIFMHWGVYSGDPSFYISPAWMWNDWINVHNPDIIAFMKANYPPNWVYADFAPIFKAEFFNPDTFAEILQSSGAKYVVLTSKHHEGFTLWPSPYSFNWNAMDVGPHRDLVGELANAIRTKTQLRFGVYYSLYEWFNPLYMADRATLYQTNHYVQSKMRPEIEDLVNRYKPEVVWSDGDWEAPDTYWNSTDFLAWLYNESPVKDTVVTNDRWGKDIPCHHGGYYTCADKYNPGVLLKHKWENCMTVDRNSWGYRRTATAADILSITELIGTLVETVSCNGNLLMNVGPTADGRIIPVFEERLRQMGAWLKVNGEAIYKSKPWEQCQNDTITKNVWYTTGSGTFLYATFWQWPTGSTPNLTLGCPQVDPGSTKISMIGVPGTLKYTSSSENIVIDLSRISFSELPNTWAWVLKFEKLPKCNFKKCFHVKGQSSLLSENSFVKVI